MGLLKKEDYCSHLNMEDITHAGYAHAKRVCKYFKMKNLGNYHDFYVQINTLLLADVLEIFRICVLRYMSLILLIFFQHQDLAWQATLKNTKVKQEVQLQRIPGI